MFQNVDFFMLAIFMIFLNSLRAKKTAMNDNFYGAFFEKFDVFNNFFQVGNIYHRFLREISISNAKLQKIYEFLTLNLVFKKFLNLL